MPRRYISHKDMEHFATALVIYVRSKDDGNLESIVEWGEKLMKAQERIDYFHITPEILKFYINQAKAQIEDAAEEDVVDVVFEPDETGTIQIVDLQNYREEKYHDDDEWGI